MDDHYLKQLLDQLDRRTLARNQGENAPQPPPAAPDAMPQSVPTPKAATAARAEATIEHARVGLPPARSAEPATPTAPTPAGTAQAPARVTHAPDTPIVRKIPAAREPQSQLLPTSRQPIRSPPTSLLRDGADASPNAIRARPIAPAVSARSAAQASTPQAGGSGAAAAFVPRSPRSFEDARLKEAEVEAIALRMLLQANASGRDIAGQLRLPFSLLEPLLNRFKADQWVVHKGSSSLSDYLYQITPAGAEIARRFQQRCSYVGPAPVALEDYIVSVRAQSVADQQVEPDDLKAVFQDLVVNPELQNQIGQSLQGGRGFFLYGAAGNGKTTIAERISLAFGQTIWIPRAISVAGEIIQLFDRCKHKEAPLADKEPIKTLDVDRRWVRINRPTIVAGGELTLEQLEISVNKWTGVCEAPLQLKSNCGTLLIDDFGRQRMGASELLNRWIVPLDRGCDYLNLPSGHTIQVPFDQLLVFSTNLQPKDLVDEAFLRRLPYKIEAPDPTESEFRSLCRTYGEKLNVTYSAEAVDHLIAKHYRSKRRPFRFCQPRDLLTQVRNYCRFNKLPAAMTPQSFDVAAHNYFSLMGSF